MPLQPVILLHYTLTSDSVPLKAGHLTFAQAASAALVILSSNGNIHAIVK